MTAPTQDIPTVIESQDSPSPTSPVNEEASEIETWETEAEKIKQKLEALKEKNQRQNKANFACWSPMLHHLESWSLNKLQRKLENLKDSC